MQKFLQQKTCELLAKERSESERAFILKVLTRKGRKTAAARSEAAPWLSLPLLLPLHGNRAYSLA